MFWSNKCKTNHEKLLVCVSEGTDHLFHRVIVYRQWVVSLGKVINQALHNWSFLYVVVVMSIPAGTVIAFVLDLIAILSVRKFALLGKSHFNPVRHVYNKNSLRIHWRVVIYLNLNELMTQMTKTVSICKKTSLSNSIDTARTRNRKRTSENSHALLFDILTSQDLEANLFQPIEMFQNIALFFLTVFLPTEGRKNADKMILLVCHWALNSNLWASHPDFTAIKDNS